MGISGLLGRGRTELMMAVTGGYRNEGDGEVYYWMVRRCSLNDPKQAIRTGIGFVTEAEKGTG